MVVFYFCLFEVGNNLYFKCGLVFLALNMNKEATLPLVFVRSIGLVL